MKTDDNRGELEGAGKAPVVAAQSDKACVDIMRQELRTWLTDHGIHGPAPTPEAEGKAMWAWIRDFHKEYNDDWFTRNMPRLHERFKPVFMEEMRARKAAVKAAAAQVQPVAAVDLMDMGSASPATSAANDLLDMGCTIAVASAAAPAPAQPAGLLDLDLSAPAPAAVATPNPPTGLLDLDIAAAPQPPARPSFSLDPFAPSGATAPAVAVLADPLDPLAVATSTSQASGEQPLASAGMLDPFAISASAAPSGPVVSDPDPFAAALNAGQPTQTCAPVAAPHAASLDPFAGVASSTAPASGATSASVSLDPFAAVASFVAPSAAPVAAVAPAAPIAVATVPVEPIAVVAAPGAPVLALDPFANLVSSSNTSQGVATVPAVLPSDGLASLDPFNAQPADMPMPATQQQGMGDLGIGMLNLGGGTSNIAPKASTSNNAFGDLF